MINVVSTFRRSNTGIRRSFFYERLNLSFLTQTRCPNLAGNSNNYTFYLMRSVQNYTDQISPAVASPLSRDIGFRPNLVQVFNIMITRLDPDLSDSLPLRSPDYHLYSALNYSRSPLVEYLQSSLLNLVDTSGLFFPTILNRKDSLTLTYTQI